MKQSKLYESKKRATAKEARDLRMGDIIECYYADSEKPVHEMVVATTYNSREGNYADIRTVRIPALGLRSNDATAGTNWLNTDKFRRIAFGADLSGLLQNIANQAAGLFSLTEAVAARDERPAQRRKEPPVPLASADSQDAEESDETAPRKGKKISY